MRSVKHLVSAVVLGAALAAMPVNMSEAGGLGVYFGGPGWVLGPGGVYIGPGGARYRPWYEPGWYYYGDYYYYKPHRRRYCRTDWRHATVTIRRHGRVFYLRPC